MKKHPTPMFAFIENAEALVAEAKLQRIKFGISWREFLVGAAVLGFNGEQYKIFGGANMKPNEFGQKICAEPQAIKQAYLEGYFEIVAVTVVAQPQDDPTLHPCAECRKLFRHLYHLADDTIIYTISIEDNGPIQFHTFQQIAIIHNDN